MGALIGDARVLVRRDWQMIERVAAALEQRGDLRARSLATGSAELHHQSGRDQRGKLPPLTRQLFVLPFAFTARAVGKVLAFCRPRLEFPSHIKETTPEQAIALHPCGWIRGGKGRIRDWHDGTQISLATLTCAAAALAL